MIRLRMKRKIKKEESGRVMSNENSGRLVVSPMIKSIRIEMDEKMNYHEEDIEKLRKKVLSIQKKLGVQFDQWCIDNEVRWKYAENTSLEEAYKRFIDDNDYASETDSLRAQVNRLVKISKEQREKISELKLIIHEKDQEILQLQEYLSVINSGSNN